nr:AraC family transcriptional regulator [Clostridium tetanomorphum]
MKKSKKLLNKNSLSILDVGLSVRFNNQNYFSLIFKKLTNKSSIQFRNEKLKNSIT